MKLPGAVGTGVDLLDADVPSRRVHEAAAAAAFAAAGASCRPRRRSLAGFAAAGMDAHLLLAAADDPLERQDRATTLVPRRAGSAPKQPPKRPPPMSRPGTGEEVFEALVEVLGREAGDAGMAAGIVVGGFLGSGTGVASAISLKRSSAPGSLFLSGWYLRASLRGLLDRLLVARAGRRAARSSPAVQPGRHRQEAMRWTTRHRWPVRRTDSHQAGRGAAATAWPPLWRSLPRRRLRRRASSPRRKLDIGRQLHRDPRWANSMPFSWKAPTGCRAPCAARTACPACS